MNLPSCALCKGHTCPGCLVSFRLSSACTHALSSNTCNPCLFLQAMQPSQASVSSCIWYLCCTGQQALNLTIRNMSNTLSNTSPHHPPGTSRACGAVVVR